MSTSTNAPPVRVIFLDVGQGDSTLVMLPSDGHEVCAILIDCPTGKSRAVTRLLDDLGVTRLELVVITHSDADHSGGIESTLATFMNGRGSVKKARSIGRVAYLLDTATPGSHVRGLHDYLGDLYEGGEVVFVERRLESFTLLDVRVDFIHPDLGTTFHSFGRDINTQSQIMLMEYGKARVLFASDMTQGAWQAIAGRNPVAGDTEGGEDALRANIIKFPHHGAKWPDDTVLYEMLDRVRPTYVVISTGTRNTFGHPRDQVFRVLKRVASVERILCTQATPARCGAANTANFHCAGTIEATIYPHGAGAIAPSPGDHSIRIDKLPNPACQHWRVRDPGRGATNPAHRPPADDGLGLLR